MPTTLPNALTNSAAYEHTERVDLQKRLKKATTTIQALTALVGALTALLVALAALGGHLPSFGGGPGASAASPKSEARVEKPLPNIPPYVSPRVDGGHTNVEMCAGALAQHRAEYPNLQIDPVYDPDEHIEKDWKAHATYQYVCYFKVAKKP